MMNLPQRRSVDKNTECTSSSFLLILIKDISMRSQDYMFAFQLSIDDHEREERYAL